MRRGIVAASLLLSTLLAQPVRAVAQEAQRSDTVPSAATDPLFTPADAYFVGGFLLGTLAMSPLDRQIAHAVQDSVFQENRWLRDGSDFFRVLGVPGAIVSGASIYVLGRAMDRPRLADLGLHTTESIILAGVLTMPLKSIVGRARPLVDVSNPYNFGLGRGWRKDDYQSFPSGHASTAFATAAAVTTELGDWWPEHKIEIGTVMFTGATFVAISRLYNNKHWASDVVVGAAIGSFSGWKVVRYTHAHRNNPLDRWLLPTAAIPARGGGVMLVWMIGG